MKFTILPMTAILLFAFACKKEEKKEDPKPTPFVNINFGYNPNFSGITLWKNQTAIQVDSITAHDYFGVSIAETNVSSLYGFTVDSGVIAFEARTGADVEVFNTRENVAVKTTYSYDLFGAKEFGAESFLPYKISSVAVKGNDTIEINGSGDKVRIHYQSLYSGLIGKDSITVTP